MNAITASLVFYNVFHHFKRTNVPAAAAWLKVRDVYSIVIIFLSAAYLTGAVDWIPLRDVSTGYFLYDSVILLKETGVRSFRNVVYDTLFYVVFTLSLPTLGAIGYLSKIVSLMRGHHTWPLFLVFRIINFSYCLWYAWMYTHYTVTLGLFVIWALNIRWFIILHRTIMLRQAWKDILTGLRTPHPSTYASQSS